MGDMVKVQVIEIDPKSGKISLDRLEKPDAPEGSAPAPATSAATAKIAASVATAARKTDHHPSFQTAKPTSIAPRVVATQAPPHTQIIGVCGLRLHKPRITQPR